MMDLTTLNKDLVYYLASPYTAMNAPNPIVEVLIQNKRYAEITAVAAKLTLEGFILLTPITVSHMLKAYEPSLGTTWNFWKRIDTKLLEKADAMIVVQMEGWAESVGVTAEIGIMENAKKPIFYMAPTEILSTY